MSGWDEYWDRPRGAYDRIAGIYRRRVIRPQLARVISRHFAAGSRLLHAGCGGGEVDAGITKAMSIVGVDLSMAALRRYRSHTAGSRLCSGNILSLPFRDGSLDGVYNLGVVEHMTEREIVAAFREMHRVIRPGGKIVIFWPHRRASSVFVLRLVHRFRSTPLHPPEISLLRSKSEARRILNDAGFDLVDYEFGPRDGFVQAVVVGSRR